VEHHAHVSVGDINLRSRTGRALLLIWKILGLTMLAWLLLLASHNGSVDLLLDLAAVLAADPQAGWLLGIVLGMLALVTLAAWLWGALAVVGSAIALPLILCIVVPALHNGLPAYLVAPPVAAFMAFAAILLTYGRKEFGIGVAATVAVCGCLALVTAVACWVLPRSGLGGAAEITAVVLAGAAAYVDTAATQVSTVAELSDNILRRAWRVGTVHLSSMIHTFTLAVVGVAVTGLLQAYDGGDTAAMVAELKPDIAVVALVTGGIAMVIPVSTVLAWLLCRHSAPSAAHDAAADLNG
jgi:hypothetical protein